MFDSREKERGNIFSLDLLIREHVSTFTLLL